MNLFSLFRVELRRLLQSRTVLGAALLSILSLPLGNLLMIFYGSQVMSSRYILTPVLSGTTVGAVLWAAAALMEADRLQRSGVHVLADAISVPGALCAARTLALMTVSMLVVLLTALVYAPYTAEKMSYLFRPGFYSANFAVFMLPTWWISILFADAFYQLTRRVELSVVLYVLLAGVSVSGIVARDYFLRWLNPYVITYSDGFLSVWPLRIGLYTRIIWLCIALGAWTTSFLFMRRYQRGLVFSFLKSGKKLRKLLPAAVLAASGVWLWHAQPFIDHGPDSYDYADSFMMDADHTVNARCHLKVNPVTGTVSVKAEYDILVPYDGETVFYLNPGYRITKMTYGGETVSFRTIDSDLNGQRPTRFSLPSKTPGKTLLIEYSGFPAQAKYAAGSLVDDMVDRDYISLDTTSLFPRFEGYFVQTAVTDFTIPDSLTPFCNYVQMTDSVDNGDGTRTWTQNTENYIGDFTAGYYRTNTFSINDLTVDFAYGAAYQKIVVENDIEQVIIDILTYCSEHYGELWSAEDNHLLLRQESSMFMGGYAVHGVSTWFETVLAPDTLSDPDKGASATEVFIHEMIHQWWGGLGLNCADEELWSAEGLTVYSTYRLVKEKYGALYAQQYYVDMWKDAVENQNRSFYNRHPEYLELLPSVYQTSLELSNRSVNQYQRMPLMILKAEALVGGEAQMDEILRKIYADRDAFHDNKFRFSDFLNYCGLTEEDLRLE
ncbi:MAG: hypothetical protein K2P63_05080 [Lachnospiraceae bacterium]|nr:hypothetical protein [Lachnospiraceae bacterium]